MKQKTRFLNLTLKLLYFNTYSGNEHIMSDFIIQETQRLGFRTKKDDLGNIYAVRGKADKYPLLNAHMDIVFDIAKPVQNIVRFSSIKETNSVQTKCFNCANVYDCAYIEMKASKKTWNEAYNDLISKDLAPKCQSYVYDEYVNNYSPYSKSLYSYDDYTYCNSGYAWGTSQYTLDELEDIDKYLEEHFKLTHDTQNGRITSNRLRIPGGDDKCGIAIALQTARELPHQPMKLLFTVGEEIGCDGISYFCKHNAKWFDDVAYSLTLDRRGNDNLLMYSCGAANCTTNFAAQLASIGIKNGIQIKMERGTLADVIYIRRYVQECVNMSAGYFNPHTTDEYIDFNGMLNIKEWVKNILLEV